MRLYILLLATSIVCCTKSIESPYNKMISQSSQNITIQIFTGQEAKKYVNDIAQIRITLFSEYPYLYKGTIACEKEYLETYFKSPHATILLVFDDNRVVGFSNAIPLTEECNEIKDPFIQKGLNLHEYLYIGEVMIYPQYRGKGILRNFFEFHEKKAYKEGYKYTIFMTVERPDNHLYKPNDYNSLDAIWQHFGYEKVPNLQVQLAWTQIDTHQETNNTLAIWQKLIPYTIK